MRLVLKAKRSLASFRSCRTITTGTATSEKLPKDAAIARIIAALFFLGASVKVMPFAAGALVEHTVKLMRTEVPFLQSTGLNRLYYLLYFEASRKKAIDVGALEAMANICLKLPAPQQHRYLVVLDTLSGCEDFRKHLDCSVLRNLLFSLEEMQLDEPDEYCRNIELASRYHLARTLFKHHCS